MTSESEYLQGRVVEAYAKLDASEYEPGMGCWVTGLVALIITGVLVWIL